MGDGTARAWGARILAPLAFFSAATVLVLLVHRSLTADERRPETPAAQATGTQAAPGTQAGTTTTKAPVKKRFYVVRAGDTLEGIAARFNTTTADLLELNPDIDPLALSPGQRIRVR